MSTINSGVGRLLAGAGGVLLFASLFMTWAGLPGGAGETGWEFAGAIDILCVIVALLGIAAALTGGRFGFFRPDVSLNGAADMLAVGASVVLGWLIALDFPAGAGREPGVYLALVGAIAVACGAGDFRVTSLFPEMRARGGEMAPPSG